MKKKVGVNKDVVTIPKKVMFGIAPAIAIGGILVSKHQPGPLVLFLLGISIGIIIGKGIWEK
jgi:hypothetical protein